MVNRTFNATSTERLQQCPLLFAVNCTYCTFFLWRLHLAPPSHPGQSTTLLWLESPGGKYAKLHTVPANNRDPMSSSFCFCLFPTHIWVLFFAYIPFVANRRFNTTLTEWLQPDMGRLQHKCNWLRLLATCSITITNEQNHNVIDCDYIKSNHDYNRDDICLETSSDRKQTPFAWFDVSIFLDNIWY